jgi:hypothetical protein
MRRQGNTIWVDVYNSDDGRRFCAAQEPSRNGATDFAEVMRFNSEGKPATLHAQPVRGRATWLPGSPPEIGP